jgi:guanine nucleotide-binding protein G(i) subunit alpha
MGNLCGAQGPRGSPEEEKKNDQINNQLRKEKARLDAEIKLLLLGAGESGKSTIAKQMKIIHLDGFSKEERESYRSIIASNTVGSMRVLITAAADMGLELARDNKDPASRLMGEAGGFGGLLTPQAGKDIKALWSDPAIRAAYARSSEFQLNDSAGYYFDTIDRLVLPDYIPSEQDVLRSRTKTTGIIETEFDVEGTHFRMVDVGGQRSERKKWMYCFQDVTAVIFCVALSEYDLKLYEDDTTNRMHESLKLFKEICNTKWFINTSMILFLNKRDLFAEKIQRVDLNICFPEYTGGKNYDNATQYIKRMFLAQNENPKKTIYTHFTCATDTDNITVVFNAVKDILLNQTLTEAGMV